MNFKGSIELGKMGEGREKGFKDNGTCIRWHLRWTMRVYYLTM